MAGTGVSKGSLHTLSVANVDRLSLWRPVEVDEMLSHDYETLRDIWIIGNGALESRINGRA